jgi:phytoene/squalene synthetase
MQLYQETAYKISKIVTINYSTSFSLATRLFDKEMRKAIYSIYGFVRFADEIVDSFHGYNKRYLLEKFESDYYDAINQGISLNPVLNSFLLTVNKYQIPDEYIKAFLKSMKFDLYKNDYKSKAEADEYIYGSADVVGLMCLKVFCNGNDKLYKELEYPAMKLGSAFQKVNFLRDIKNDLEILDRHYFPEICTTMLNNDSKSTIINDIENDFNIAFQGIRKLPGRSKLAVLIAYYYYRILLNKIRHKTAGKILETRIRISNRKKMILLLKAMLVYKLNLV